MTDRVIHISEEEAASDFASVLARVRAGAEVVIESEARAVAVLRPAAEVHGRRLSESIALADAHARELGSEPTMDADYAADLEDIIKNRKPRDVAEWD